MELLFAVSGVILYVSSVLYYTATTDRKIAKRHGYCDRRAKSMQSWGMAGMLIALGNIIWILGFWAK